MRVCVSIGVCVGVCVCVCVSERAMWTRECNSIFTGPRGTRTVTNILEGHAAGTAHHRCQ